jgi:hypothetical protein
MKTLSYELLKKHDAIITHEGSTDKDGHLVPLVMITGDKLESLINEVISQRLQKVGQMQGWSDPLIYESLPEGTNLYAINHLIDHKG